MTHTTETKTNSTKENPQTGKPDTMTQNKTAPVIDAEKPQKQKPINTMNCIKTNPEYRKAVQTACRKAFETACDREHFSARMDGIAHIIREISDTPHSDENFIAGAAWALLTIIGWSE